MIGKVATANRLREGDIVYLTEERVWSPNLQDAWVTEIKMTRALSSDL